MEIKIGDLVYIPSEAVLTKFSKKNSYSTCCKTTEPKNLLVAEMKAGLVGVLFQGSLWYAQEKDVFILGENNG